ncbi:MAG: PAS domain S-box protein [Nostoc sp. TH1S01]|nr:PAS domain S-box protein [Nostoc sp. TH1S01]
MKLYPRLLAYSVAIASTAIALLLSLCLEPIIYRTTGSFFYISIVVSTWYGGFRPGIVAIVLSTLAMEYFFIPPVHILWVEQPKNLLRLGIFLVVSWTINLLTSNLQASRQKIQQLNQKLAQENAEQLRQSEQRYRSLINASAQIVWIADANGIAKSSPKGWEELTGQTPAEYMGGGWLNVVHPDDRDRTVECWQESYTNRTIYETEFRVRMKDGNYRNFVVRGVPILDVNGEVSEWIGTCTDITERKQAEAALQESQIKLQRQLAEIETIYQSAPIGLNVLDTELRFVRINQRLAEINGFSVEEHIGRTVRELLPNLADTAEQLLLPILQTGKPLLNVEISGETPAQPGVRRTWLESFLPLKDGDRIIGISTVCEEITEHKRVEQTLAKQALRIRALFNTSFDGIVILDLYGNVVDANPRFAQMLGYTPEETAKLSVFDWNAQYTPQEIQQVLDDHLRWNNVVFETLHRRKDGSVYDVEIGATIVELEGEILRFCVCRDISDRKQAEAELERRVVQRTAELSQSNAELKRSESTLRSFFNSAAMLMGIVELHEHDIFHISDNLASAQFFGTTPEAMQNRFASDLGVTQPIIKQWMSYYQQAALIQAPMRFQYLHENHSGKKWLSVSVCPIAVSPAGYPMFSYIVEDITEQKHAKEQIETSLREKEVLLKEIHHRVKNNLGIVSSLLKMQSRRIQDSQAYAILLDSQNRIDSIALVHEKLYLSEDLGNIDFAYYIPNLIGYLFSTYNINSDKIKLNTQIDNIYLDIETAIPCGLIISELVVNTLKYAFPNNQAGEIQIKFYQNIDNKLILIIKDNGIGLPENIAFNHSKKMGINLVQGLVKQLRGTMEITCQPGAEFKICLTKPEENRK